MQLQSVYFIGAGGIGMSALVRYYLMHNFTVGGYDRTATTLTNELEEEGALLHFDDDITLIPDAFKHKNHTLVVYTPAIPDTHKELSWFRKEGFQICKRAEILGRLTRRMKGLCVAGTHGKTTTTTILAHILRESHLGCNAFLGGISKNFGGNYLLDSKSENVVIEADEFDRSFHHLTPYATAITATDADHLDIYGTEKAYLESFTHYTSLIRPGGALIVHRNLKMEENLQEGVRRYDYARKEGDFHATNERIGDGRIIFDLVSPFENIKDIELGVPVSINIDNSIAAIALAQIVGAKADEIRSALLSYKGVDRRFDFHLKTPRAVFLSDYAHHPAEIRQCIKSLREVFKGRKISIVFQPHLYTRTRDFYKEFAESLSLADEVMLTEIYPARERPIKGVDSQLIYDELNPNIERHLIRKADICKLIDKHDIDVLAFVGAGDLEDYAPEITSQIKDKLKDKDWNMQNQSH